MAAAHLFNRYDVTPVTVTLVDGPMEATKVPETWGQEDEEIKQITNDN